MLAVLALLVGLGIWTCLDHWPIAAGRCRLRRKSTGNPSENPLIGLTGLALRPGSMDPSLMGDLSQNARKWASYRMTVGTEEVLMAMYISDASRLLVDTNGNGNLTDERGFVPETMGHLAWLLSSDLNYKRYRFGPIRVKCGTGEEQSTVSFYAACRKPNRPVNLSIYPSHYLTGRMRLGGKVYTVALVDGDYDGHFRSVVSLPVRSVYRLRADMFAIDTNRDGEFDWPLSPGSEVMPLGRLICLDDTYYTVTVSPDDRNLALDAVEPAIGQLAIAPAHASMDLHLWSDAAGQTLRAVNAADLPAGAYQTVDATLILRDSEYNDWRYVMVRGRPGSLGFFKINSGQTTRIQVGPPFLVTVDLARHGDRVFLTPCIRGIAGEVYHAVAKNSRDPSKLAFRIVSEDGTVLVDDAIRYSGGGSSQYTWRVPTDFKGKYQVQIEADLGPFEVTHDREWFVIE